MAETFKRIPKHIGIIPDGNRRWALNNSLQKKEGYTHGVQPGYQLYETMLKHNIKEATFYGFTKDNTGRPVSQIAAYTQACIDAVKCVSERDANILVVGNTSSKYFPEELLPYANNRVCYGKGLINLNFLINYDWNWDLQEGFKNVSQGKIKGEIGENIASKDISKIDLIIRWGNRRRLSGFLPVQSVYSDFFIVDELWPDFTEKHFTDALRWYETCDVTRGG